jgi:hypothetical protein
MEFVGCMELGRSAGGFCCDVDVCFVVEEEEAQQF